MPASIVSAPEFPIPEQVCKITFAGLHADTNFVRLFPVSAPLGSALRESLDAAKGELAEVHSGPSDKPWNFTPDKGGVYTFKLDETEIRPASGSQFQDDPTGSPLPTPTQSGNVVLYVGQRLELKMGQSPDEVTLRLYVWNDTVRATTLKIHNEDTPALVDPTSPLAENASYDSALLLTLADLVGVTATNIAGTLPTDFVTIRNLYSGHITGGEHTNADDVNTLSAGWTAINNKAAEEAINALRSALDSHARQLVDEAEDEVHPVIDGETSFFSSGASDDVSTQFFALADALVRLRDHADLDPPHATVTPISGSVGPLMDVFVAYIEALKNQVPAIPTAKNPGAAVLGQLAGFTEA